MADTAPPPEVIEKMMLCVRGVPNVIEAHDLKVRSIGGLYNLSVHIVVDPNLTVAEGHLAAKEVEHCLINEIGDVGDIVIHVDPNQPREGS